MMARDLLPFLEHGRFGKIIDRMAEGEQDD